MQLSFAGDADETVWRHRRVLIECYRRSKGKAWEPPKGIEGRPFFDWAIGAGFLRVVDGRCGFERMKDSMVAWTDAGASFMQAYFEMENAPCP